jgi:hypothetical protein
MDVGPFGQAGAFGACASLGLGLVAVVGLGAVVATPLVVAGAVGAVEPPLEQPARAPATISSTGRTVRAASRRGRAGRGWPPGAAPGGEPGVRVRELTDGMTASDLMPGPPDGRLPGALTVRRGRRPHGGNIPMLTASVPAIQAPSARRRRVFSTVGPITAPPPPR